MMSGDFNFFGRPAKYVLHPKVSDFLSRLHGVRRSGLKHPDPTARCWKARCPAHVDKNNELSLLISGYSDGGVSCKCEKGCPSRKVWARLGYKVDIIPRSSNIVPSSIENTPSVDNNQGISRDVQWALDRLANVKPGVDDHHWTALCPAHADHKPSLSVGIGKNGKLLIYCHTGCTFEEIVNALQEEDMELDKPKLKVVPLRPKKEAPAPAPASEAPSAKVVKLAPRGKLTIAQLAKAKKLPEDFLRNDCRLREGFFNNGVLIDYLNFDQAVAITRTRFALKGKDRFRWAKGSKISNLYGEWRVRDDLKRNKGELHLVEGESDCWTLWFHKLAALGIPGATLFKRLTAEHLVGVKRIIISREPGDAGTKFAAGLVALLRELKFRGAVRQVNHTKRIKDFSEMHIKGAK